MTLCSNSDDLVLDFGSFKFFDNFVNLARMSIQIIIEFPQLVNQIFLIDTYGQFFVDFDCDIYIFCVAMALLRCFFFILPKELLVVL